MHGWSLMLGGLPLRGCMRVENVTCIAVISGYVGQVVSPLVLLLPVHNISHRVCNFNIHVISFIVSK